MASLRVKKSKVPRLLRRNKARSPMAKKSVAKTMRFRYNIEIDPVTKWLAEHSDEVSKFAGQCIGIDKHNYGIVASGTTSTEVVIAAQKIDPEKEIILYKVPPDGLSM
jgi:hypothetical protein